MLSFEDLSPVKFEEFCCDLLHDLLFAQIAEITSHNRSILAAYKAAALPGEKLPGFAAILERKLSTIEKDFEENYRDYCKFCTEVVAYLLAEQSKEIIDFLPIHPNQSKSMQPEAHNPDEDVPF